MANQTALVCLIGTWSTVSEPNFGALWHIPRGKKPSFFLKLTNVGILANFLLTDKAQTMAQIITPGSQISKGYPGTVHAITSPWGEIELKCYLK